MRRVVITGVGIVSPCGATAEKTWDSVSNGRSGIDRITNFNPEAFASQIAGECTDYDPLLYMQKKELRTFDHFIKLGIGAGVQAWRDSGISPTDEESERIACMIGVGFCGMPMVEAQRDVLVARGPRRVTPYFIPGVIQNLVPGQLAVRLGIRGANIVTSSACASGAHATGEALRAIRHGYIDAALCGGAEACVSPLSVAGFASLKALSKRNDSPQTASRPWDKGRDGFVIGEGSAMFVLEEREAAIKRGARIYAEILGYGATADAFHITRPMPGAHGARKAMASALSDAGVNTSDIDYINAHATSTPAGDEEETQAIKGVFGEHATSGLMVSGTKSMTGHLLGAAGALELALCALSIRNQLVPPTINLEDPMDVAEGMDLVPHTAREARVKTVLTNSFGFGGTNASLVLGAHK